MGLVFTTLLGGCTWTQDQSDMLALRAMGAEPLAPQYPVCRSSAATGGCTTTTVGYSNVQNATEAEEWIGAAAADSYTKCSTFVARMAYGDNAFNAGLDITAIALAGAGAITVPLHSAHTFAALAGIAGATKAALNSDIFMQNAAPVIAQKINTTYGPEIRTFFGQTTSATQANLASLYGQLLVDHSDFTLTSALAAFGTGTTASASKPPPATSALGTSVLLAGAIIVDLTKQLQYQVTTSYSSSTGKFSYVQAQIGAFFPANFASATSVSAADFLTTANSNGAFLMTSGSP